MIEKVRLLCVLSYPFTFLFVLSVYYIKLINDTLKKIPKKKKPQNQFCMIYLKSVTFDLDNFNINNIYVVLMVWSSNLSEFCVILIQNGIKLEK